MKIQIKYKVLEKNRTSPYQSKQYNYRRWYHDPQIGLIGKNGCDVGFYATDIEGLLYRGVWRNTERVYECKVKGREAGNPPFKSCYEYLQIIRRLSETEVRDLARAEHDRLGYLLEEMLYPINPLLVKRKQIAPTKKELD